MIKCSQVNCTLQATRIVCMQEGLSFWCDAHDPGIVALERTIGGSGLEKSARLKAAIDKAKGLSDAVTY